MKQTIFFMNFKRNYIFQDISIFYRKENGLYIDLTAFEIGEDSRGIVLPTDEQYVISFMNTFAEHRKCIAEISLAELQMLANLKSKRFANQSKRSAGREEEGNNFLALYCAKTVVNYRYGKCHLIEEETNAKSGIYAFTRHDGYNHYPVVLKKEFRRI